MRLDLAGPHIRADTCDWRTACLNHGKKTSNGMSGMRQSILYRYSMSRAHLQSMDRFTATEELTDAASPGPDADTAIADAEIRRERDCRLLHRGCGFGRRRAGAEARAGGVSCGRVGG